MLIADNWHDYQVVDAGNGEKLERWGEYLLRRPDPVVIWDPYSPSLWDKADAVYHRNAKGGGVWEFHKSLPEKWLIRYKHLSFSVRPTGFKHTGLFPEQAANWDYLTEMLSAKTNPRVLNLFAYTGGATMAALAAGAHVTHVDAVKSMIAWAKENQVLCGINGSVNYYTDDCERLVERELRRKNLYDCVIMDPPSYGRGPNGEVWKLEDKLAHLIERCEGLLAPGAFFILNSYSTYLGTTAIENILRSKLVCKRGGSVIAHELVVPISSSGLFLPCGVVGRWES